MVHSLETMDALHKRRKKLEPLRKAFIGKQFVWEPNCPTARAVVEVTDVQNNGDGILVLTKMADGSDPRSFPNSLDRFLEAIGHSDEQSLQNVENVAETSNPLVAVVRIENRDGISRTVVRKATDNSFEETVILLESILRENDEPTDIRVQFFSLC